jgi:hypothetical protein
MTRPSSPPISTNFWLDFPLASTLYTEWPRRSKTKYCPDAIC